MITVNKLPLEQISGVTKSIRSIGLGTMGFADALYKLKIPYGSESCTVFINCLYNIIRETAVETSMELALEKGTYDKWKKSIWAKYNIMIRNSNLISIAPNGSISFIANTSGGLEPNFALVYSRRMNDGTLFYMINPVFEKYLKENNLYSKNLLQKIADNNGSCQGINEIPIKDQKVFLVSTDLTPEQHLDVLTEIQRYVDLACSKTINLPHDAKIEDIEDIYFKAWKYGVKGITVYRDGSRENQTLSVKREKNRVESDFDIGKEKVIFDSIEPVSKDDLGETYGINAKKYVACGKLYPNVCRDSDGNLVEVFINTGKRGVCQSNINAISRLISMSLRAGIKVEEIIDQLKGTICPACTKASTKGEKLSGLSCADVIGRALEDAYNKEEIIIKRNFLNDSVCKIENVAEFKCDKSNLSLCPDCGKLSIKSEGACVSCIECGWSKC